ncbi:PAS domain-containing protein [Haloarcula salina]|uniref:histidine kinase n=1 Tax=Haloarcula salina TaxID=1429914 RepID=A0AA41FYU5_9EURY|nr:PAS domain-containing protein [Haloarcula salina]MBV0901295.1 PAS domain-containing protein [Haloarcula salina]
MASTEGESQPYRDVFDASPDPIFVHDPDSGEVTGANAAAADLLGVDPEQIAGMHVGDFSPPEYSTAAANDLIRTAHETGESHVEWKVEGPDGDPRWTDVELRGTTIDGEPRVVAYARDVTEYRAAEQRYRTERNLLDRLLDVSPVGIVIHGADGTIQRTNERAESMLGVDRAELVGAESVPVQFDLRTVDGDPLSEDRAPVERVLETGSTVTDTELRFTRGDGEKVVASVSATPMFGDGGSIERVVVSLADVTTRRERERRRKERNEQLRTMVDNLPVVVFTLDPDGVFTHSAGRGLATLGLEAGELEGVSVFDAYAGYPDVIDAVTAALDGEEVRTTQALDGLTFETWYQPVHDDAGDLKNVVGVARDITELTRRQARVERLNDATQELLFAESREEIGDAVTRIARDVTGRPLAAMWAYDEEAHELNLVGTTIENAEFEPPDDVDVAPVEPGHDEMSIFEDGEVTYIRDYRELSAPSNPDAPLRSVLCLPLDEYGMLMIGAESVEQYGETERHLLEILSSTTTAALDRAERAHELREYRDELERSNESLQQFAYVASHDLQEPLRMVSSYVDLLDSEYGDDLDDEASEYMAFAVDGARRMQEMIDGLLAYSRVQTDAREFEETDATAVLDETITALQFHIADADAEVTAADLPPVEADSNQLGQVFQNLVKNAVTYADDGETPPRIEIDAERGEEMVTFSVSDNGPGIPESAREDVFEVFTRAGTHDAEGTGIGLPVCERIVHRHGGEIWVESPPGEGATFRFTVPAVTEQENYV